jgi:hypothetical protein
LEAGLRVAVVQLQAEVRRLEEVIAAGESEAIAKCDCPDLDNAATQDILTDAEREAVSWYAAYGAGEHAATLRSLLERQQDTPAAHATPSEGTSQDGCTLTDAEREAVEAALGEVDGVYPETAATLRGLLERL